MRKIYSILSVFLVLSVLVANGQSLIKTSPVQRQGKNIGPEGKLSWTNAPSLNAPGCDTLLYNPNNPALYGIASYTWGTGNGYINGTNVYEDQQVGNYFDVSGSTNSNYVTGIRFYLAKANGLDLTKTVFFRVYDIGSSITLAGSSAAIPLSALKAVVGGYVDYKFPTPIAIPNKEFIVSMDFSNLSWAAKDSISMASSSLNSPTSPIPDSAVVMDVDGDWYFTSTTASGLAAGMFVYLFPYVSDNQNCTLPIKLSGFAGSAVGAYNKLHWTTATELSNGGFEIQRSSDGVHFEKIEFIASQSLVGTSSRSIDYGFTDENPVMGNNFYRLKQIDLDGKSVYSAVVLVSRSKSLTKGILAYYPNPVKSKMNIQLSATQPGNAMVTVTNTIGAVVLQQSVKTTGNTQTIELNVANLPKGTYFVKLSGEKNAATFVKE